MKRFIIVGAVIFLFSCGADYSTDKSKYSYGLGQQIGDNMKRQDIPIDEDAFIAGFKDAMKGNEGPIDKNELREAMREMSRIKREKREAEEEINKKTAEENLAAGSEFLAANKKKEGVKETASGLQYRVLTQGSGILPAGDDIVKVNYKGTLIDGTEFDSSYGRGQPSQFSLSGVIKGWTEGLKLMKTGAKFEFVIPPDLAYGERPRPGIPGNSVLVFEVELLDVKKR